MDAQSQIKKLKNLFSTLSALIDSINVSHDCQVLINEPIKKLDENSKCGVNFALNGNGIVSGNAWRNEPTINLDTSSAIIPRSTTICQQAATVANSMCGFDSTPHINGMNGNDIVSGNAWRNEPTINLDTSSAIIPRSTTICQQAATVANSMFGFDSASHINGMNIDYRNMLIGQEILPTKFYVNSDTLSDSMYGFGCASNGNRMDSGCWNVNSATLNTSMHGFDFASDGNGTDNGCWNKTSNVERGNAWRNEPTKNLDAPLMDSAVSSCLVCCNERSNAWRNEPTKNIDAPLMYSAAPSYLVFCNERGNAWRNEPTTNLNASSAIVYPSTSTKICQRSVSVENSMCGFDTTSHINGMNSSYRNVMNNQAMGIELPNLSDFNEAHLQSILNKEKSTTLTNYLYYLLPDGSDGNMQQEDYLNIHEKPMTGDQDIELDANVTIGERNELDGNETKGNIQQEDYLNIHENPMTADREIEVDVNVTFGEITKLDGNERKRLTESVITKPKPMRGCDNSFMFTKTSDDGSPKKLCCPYCETLFSKLPIHLERKHMNEPDVQRFLSFPIGSKQRRLILDSLRKTGLTIWNKNAALNKNELIPSRRPNPKFGNDGSRFKICPYCNGFYTKSSLRLHIKYNCPQKPIVNDEKTKGKRFITALATSVEERYHENTSKALKKVYMRFRDDPLVRSLKFDWLITVYGNKLSAKHTKLKSPDMIRGRLRLIARFLSEFKRIEPEVKDLATVYHPKYYDQTIEAIQAVARFNDDVNKFGAPCTATSCVTAIKQIGAMLIAEYIKRDDQENQRLTQNFLTVMNIDIHDLINKTANENQSQMRRRRVVNLPSLADLKLLNQYIQSESNDCYNELAESFDFDKWVYLSKLTMISILIFNRKRVGDTENILLAEFECKESINENTNPQLFSSLSDEAKRIARCYSRMRVRGKLNRTVPVLLNQSMEKSLNLLIFHREDAGIPSKNEYLFALRPSPIQDTIVINAGVTLKKFAEKCGAENPSRINGTNLRKQLATMCVTLKLDDSEVADVADFMGHAELVHRNTYRQNTIDRQIVKMSQWLEAALGNEAIIDTERKTDDESRQKATELLDRLEAALGEEDRSDDVRSVATKNLKGSSDVTMKSRPCRASAPKRKISSDVTMKSKQVCVRNRKSKQPPKSKTQT